MPSHSTISDPDIHEPKGASSASSNTVYVADGAGSGSWQPFSSRYSSAVNASGYVVTNATTTSTSTTPTKLDVGTAFVQGYANSFTVSTGGRFTYTGTDTLYFKVDASVMFVNGSGTNQLYRFHVAKNGTIVSASVTEDEFDNTDPHSINVSGIVSLSQNDYVEIFVTKGSSTGTDTARTMSVNVSRV